MRIKQGGVLFLVLSAFSLLLCGLFFSISPLVLLLSALFILFIPGALAYLSFSKKPALLSFIGFSVLGSFVLNTLATLVLGSLLNAPLSKWFLFFVFSLSSFPFAFRILLLSKRALEFRLESRSALMILVLAFFARVFVFAKLNWIILGSDVGRFGSLAHAMVLKGGIMANLVPFEIIEGFFYFPGTIIIPLLFDLAGINTLVGASFALLFGNSAFLVFAFLFFSQLFSKKRAKNAFLFFAFAFDFCFLLAVSGIYPYALALPFLMLFMYALNVLSKGGHARFAFVLATLGIALFHWYVGLVAAVFGAAVACALSIEKEYARLYRIIKEFLFAAVLSAVALVPFFLTFGAYLLLPFLLQNKADLFAISTANALPLPARVLGVFVLFSQGVSFSILFVLGILFLVFDWQTLVKKKTLGLFFIFLVVFNFFLFGDNNFVRQTLIVWLFYAIAFSRVLTRTRINTIIVIAFVLVASPSPLFFFSTIVQGTFASSIPVPDASFYHAMDFIRENVSLNATFLIDGGGAGCVGRSSSYGERIFPITSRKVWYFTNTCWSAYNYTEYASRVALYHVLTLNPNNQTLHDQLLAKGVTHVFIGSFSTGLSRALFSKSMYYTEVFSDANTSIFKVA
ncbi:hypothetical protein COT72_00380 [archaeon CG10_big_fil_rev_8_21_14_0_10_43_11]|nr:MAG: hypothetical protein COT72_00380 [archaeon CG10_big_fil_rev_8_21_14_0_10_43_11]